MDLGERERIAAVLNRIHKRKFEEFLETDIGESFALHLNRIRDALSASGYSATPKHKPVYELIDIYGYRLLSHKSIGPWIREQLLRTLSERQWNRLAEQYRDLVEPVNRNNTRDGNGSWVLAQYWRQCGRWARAFCEAFGLPESLAGIRATALLDDEDVVPVEALPKLHDFQLAVYDEMRSLLKSRLPQTAFLSLPTGAGKTRVAVEAACDHLAENLKTRSNIVLWIARSQELQEQAWECFRQVWLVPPKRSGDDVITRSHSLRIVRIWGHRKPDDIEIVEGPMILIASVQQLRSWVTHGTDLASIIPRRRLACVFVDEAHSTITPEFRIVLSSLGLRAKREWELPKDGLPVIGLSATPWRSQDTESQSLTRYYKYNLVTPGSLGDEPIPVLQGRGILAWVNAERLAVRPTTRMSERDIERFRTFGDLQSEFLERLGNDAGRNARIISRLISLPTERNRVLVFACSVDHAELLAAALNRACNDRVAAVVTNKTPRAERANLIASFKRGDGPRYLCNVDVLANGFDAPAVNAVCIARPTTSPLRYEQMVGRGLRGPENGGTRDCLLIDVQDIGLPTEIMSYARVLDIWNMHSATGNGAKTAKAAG